MAASTEPLGAGAVEPEDVGGAFPRLTDAQLAQIRSIGTVRAVAPGEALFREGDRAYDFFAVEAGCVAIVQDYGGENRVIAVHGPGRFLGELNLLTGAPPLLSAIVRDPGSVIEVPVSKLRGLVARNEELSNLILRAFLARRTILIDRGAGVRLIGSRFSRDAERLREFLRRNRMPYQWFDLEQDEDAATMLEALAVTPQDTPVVIGAGGVLRNPTTGELAALLGLGARGAPPALCDLIIVGGGPAGLAAAVYGASEGLDTQLIDALAFGGQASTSARIENYLGFPTGISGSELAERAMLQARRFGARLVVPAQAQRLAHEDGNFAIELAEGDTVRGRSIIVATGASYRRLDVPGFERFEMGGIFFAATQAEGLLCAGDPVVVVGGGNSAGQAAMFLSHRAGSTALVVRGPDLSKSMSRYLINEIEAREPIEVLSCSEVIELKGEADVLEAVVLRDTQTGGQHEIDCRALFVFIGAEPHTDWLRGHVALDDHGFVLTGRDVQAESITGERPLFLETSQIGIFAVGDVHSGSVKRVASAVGEGSMAVQLVHQRLAAL
jgi:thioredoxin reductase (NADPH)